MTWQRQGEWEGEPVQAVCLPAEPSLVNELLNFKARAESVSLCWNVGDEAHRKWWQALCYISSPVLLNGASSPWCWIRTSSVCVCSHSPHLGRVLLSELCSQAPEAYAHLLACLAGPCEERGQRGGFTGIISPGECGDFPLPLQKTSILASKTRFTCVPLLWFLFVLCLQLWPADGS